MIQQQDQRIEPTGLFSINNITAGLISGFLAITGANLLVLEAASNGGYSDYVTFAWVYSTYLIGGLFSILIPLLYKMPMTGAHSLSGITYLTTTSHLFTFNELVSGFLISGIFVFLLGKTGLFHKLFRILPMEVTSAMLAGMVLHTLLSFSVHFWNDAWIVGGSIFAFILTSLFFKSIPPIFPALITSFLIWLIIKPSVHASSLPVLEGASYFPFFVPDISLAAIFVISLPLSILILSNDLLVGVNELRKEGFRSERTPIIEYSGIVSIAGSLLGSHCTNLGGIMTSICCNSSAGPKHNRYIASIISGIILVLFALFAGYLIPFILSLPKGLPAVIAFLSLFGVFVSSMRTAASNRPLYASTIPTFLISASNLHIGVVNGPLLGLTAGIFIYLIIQFIMKKS